MSKTLGFKNWSSGSVSRLREVFVILNVLDDKKEEQDRMVAQYWHAFRMMQAVTANQGDAYADILKKYDRKEEHLTDFDSFYQWQLMTPEWIDFEITPEEVERLKNGTRNTE